MNKEAFDFPPDEMSRKRFLSHALGLAVAVSVPLDWACSSKERLGSSGAPVLKGFTQEEYHNFNSMAEVFLSGSPVPGFDAGQAMDRYIYDRQETLSTEKKVKELLAVPSSVLIALLFDLSLTPFCDLPLKERETRLLSWKNSSLTLKRTVYHAYRQGTLFMLTSSQEYQDFTGYTEENYFRPFEPVSEKIKKASR